ncbi:MAG: hypothetical protein JNL18_17700 [Planctomycetaceae bacterium]|nr:hypothetical protein [Planctomycetaceae bacterium]
MKSPRLICSQVARTLLFTAPLWLTPAIGAAEGIQFRKPGAVTTPANSALPFRRAASADTVVTGPKTDADRPTSPPVATSPNALTATPTLQQVAKPLATQPRPTAVVEQAPAKSSARPVFAQPASAAAIAAASVEPAAYSTVNRSQLRNFEALDYNEPLLGPPIERQQELYAPAGYCADCNDPACGIQEPTCGCGEATCGICEPGCGIEPGCGYVEPGCGVEAGCGMEPGCGMEGCVDCGDVACGSRVNRGSDYWCFPVCLPRFRDLSVWGGVHGFKGPRDAPLFGGSGDGNFGFQEGLNFGGKTPLIGLLFPGLSYQAGYQAVQSHLSGTSGGVTNSREQDFVTIGFFRRVPAGVQFGAAWDYMNDNWITQGDFQQVRYEISIKSQRGREFGFTGSTHTNTTAIGAFDFQAVDQYRLFFRCSHRAADLRFWGGFTNDNEGILGADCYVPFNDRWSLQTGFNYIIPDGQSGVVGAREEAWNIGTNLVWHYGRGATEARTNPHRPLFNIADNGVMVIDQKP